MGEPTGVRNDGWRGGQCTPRDITRLHQQAVAKPLRFLSGEPQPAVAHRSGKGRARFLNPSTQGGARVLDTGQAW